MTATIATHVNDESVNALLFQFTDQTLHIFGDAGVIFVAVRQRPVIPIEAGNFDDADRPLPAITRHLDNFAFSRLFFKLHSATGQLDDLFRAARHRVRGDDLQTYYRLFWSANQVDDIVQAPADDIREIAFGSLSDGCNPVIPL